MASTVFSQGYDFDVSEFEKKPLEFSGTIEFQPSFIIPEKKSLSWNLKYFDKNNTPNLLDNYLLLLAPIVKFEKKGLSLYGASDSRISYNNFENDWVFNICLLEGYGRYEFNPRWSILLGKKLYKWGKGYIYNPVSYAGRQKDVNNVDVSLEGYYSVSVEYVKSFSLDVLKNLSQETVIIPVYKKLNDDYGTGDRHWFFSRTYFLIVNTDYELFFNMSEQFDYRIGMAIAHNVLTNWEIHGEFSFLPEVEKILIAENSYPEPHIVNNAIQSIIGTRYLSPFNATFYLEYIYNGAGLNNQEMQDWYISAQNVLEAQNRQAINIMSKEWFLNLNRQFVMKHYLYFKMQYPEPFYFLYFTPSLYCLFNVVDKSFLGGLDMNYKRFDAVNLNMKLIWLYGKTNSEFGSKISELKIELNVKYFF
ncbi:hypothetical protein DRP43_03870 [candidate division TA06 bacterium]|uniref:Uncharacterized protein n=1 Tax=candidate division TA06 bacterium TaxID=2250710 RepID=A0A660SJ30_UNCT6|nr:MAG: hypothetical protein DRP43_03870 [candidate division TA06 bacterium]